jgi:hypothetical protein
MLFLAACILLFFCSIVQAQKQPTRLCRQFVLEGQAVQGREWHASLGRDSTGQLWLIRLVPVNGVQNKMQSSAAFGWDIAISPAMDQDYPDALLLASPPYGSLNSREIANTYGMRAQDAIAWSPRHFHFFAATGTLYLARRSYRTLFDPNSSAASRQLASRQLLDLGSDVTAASGRLDILDAHLISGSADPAPFAAQWAAALDRIPHTLDPDAGRPSLLGEIHMLHFKLTLELPAYWKPLSGFLTAPAKCAK